MFTEHMTCWPMREQEPPCLNAKKVGVLTGPDQLRLSLINYLYLIRCTVSARHGVKQTRLLVCSSGLYKGLKLMLRAEESAALIAQVLPYGNTSSSTSSPRLLAGIHTKGLFCELHRCNSSLVRLVIVLFITFGLPPLPILIHRPYFLPPLLHGCLLFHSQLVRLISKLVFTEHQKP